MEKHLLFIGLLGFALSGNAQVIWSDNFNDEDISDWTLTDADDDGANWGDSFIVTGEGEVPITPVSLISRSWIDNQALTPDNWAVSPVINLSSVAAPVALTWHQEVSEDFPSEKYTVYVGTSNDIAELVASEVSFTTTPTEDGAVADLSLNISAFAGEVAVYIAFRHYGVTNMDYLSIDDVVVTAGVAGMNDNLMSGISVFPNPATGFVNIKSPDNVIIKEVSVQDIHGRTVKKVSFNGSKDNQIGISDLASGVYMMTISSDAGNISKKAVKN